MTRPGRAAVMDRSDSEAGFTFVELLVALSLLGLVTTMLFASLRFGVLAWSRNAVLTDRLDHITVVQMLLRRLIADAYPLFTLEGQNHGHVAFEGAETSLKFIAPSPIAIGGAGRSRFTLSLEQSGLQSNLVLNSIPELADQPNLPTETRKILVEKVHQLKFSYISKARSDSLPIWRERWENERSLPELVRIRVDFAKDDGRVWPELTIKSRITVDVGCVYDQLTKRCRGR
jgi:general secretion pathway protein J